MSITDDIFSEYTRMRESGIAIELALRSLRLYIDRLSRAKKEALADQLRQWERERRTLLEAEANTPSNTNPTPDAPTPEPPPASRQSSVIRPLKQRAPQDTSGLWVECPNCGKKNRTEDVFCYACGHLLQPTSNQFDTRSFASATDELYKSDYFGSDSVLVLNVHDSRSQFELRPQLRGNEIVIGRSAGDDTMRPDVDLIDANAADLGVSRLHIALHYDTAEEQITALDLGSSNGSFINGEKLSPKERYTLRNSDILRLGRLLITVTFIHPGEEITT